MSCDKPFELCVEQGGTIDYSATLNKWDAATEAYVPVLLSDLTALTLRLTNKADGAVINARDDLSVLNAAGGTFHTTSGRFDLHLGADDNPITPDGAELREETHVAMITATWSNGSKRWPVLIKVDNLDKLAGVTS